MAMEKQVFVEGICAGDEADAPFLVEEAEFRDGGRNGKYITCRLSDATGSMAARSGGVRPADLPKKGARTGVPVYRFPE